MKTFTYHFCVKLFAVSLFFIFLTVGCERKPVESVTQISQEQELKKLHTEANHGDKDAQYNLGLFYLKEEPGKKPNVTEGIKWLRKSAEQTNEIAQLQLANIYYLGYGIRKDYPEAIKWAMGPAKKGNLTAQLYLALCYSTKGEGFPVNYIEAIKWLRKAADQESPEAEYGLGNFYENGLGVSADYAEAFKWYSLAASHGSEVAPGFLKELTEKMTPEQIKEGNLRLTSAVTAKGK